jgi:hypothetical protein
VKKTTLPPSKQPNDPDGRNAISLRKTPTKITKKVCINRFGHTVVKMVVPLGKYLTTIKNMPKPVWIIRLLKWLYPKVNISQP